FDRKGKRLEKVKAVQTTLQCMVITKEDLDSFSDQVLPALTTDEIQNYKINFVGQQHQDNVLFYVFDVSPTAAVADKKYFEGRIWVDAHDLSVVRSQGTFETEGKNKNRGQESIVPAFATWRGQVDGRYWFPIQGRATGVLHFSTGDVSIDEVVKFT